MPPIPAPDGAARLSRQGTLGVYMQVLLRRAAVIAGAAAVTVPIERIRRAFVQQAASSERRAGQ
jgi:hypothetical protein